MDRVDFVFLILHYKNEEMTYRAIDSILSLEQLSTYRIIVVNNGSSNSLENGYERKNNNIVFLKPQENLGFSKGNNYGYEFIKKYYIPKFLIVVNNDILFVQKDFLLKLKRNYEKTKFYVAGPDIYIPWRAYHSSPIQSMPYSLEELYIGIKNFSDVQEKSQKDFSLKLFKLFVCQKARKYKFAQKIYSIWRKIQNKEIKHNIQENVMLQGSCLIFDEQFMKTSDKLFFPETFIYGEEQILSMRCQKNHWKVVYIPEMMVYHMHEGNSNITQMSYREFCVYQSKKAEYQKTAFSKCIEYLQNAER